MVFLHTDSTIVLRFEDIIDILKGNEKEVKESKIPLTIIIDDPEITRLKLMEWYFKGCKNET